MKVCDGAAAHCSTTTTRSHGTGGRRACAAPARGLLPLATVTVAHTRRRPVAGARISRTRQRMIKPPRCAFASPTSSPAVGDAMVCAREQLIMMLPITGAGVPSVRTACPTTRNGLLPGPNIWACSGATHATRIPSHRDARLGWTTIANSLLPIAANPSEGRTRSCAGSDIGTPTVNAPVWRSMLWRDSEKDGARGIASSAEVTLCRKRWGSSWVFPTSSGSGPGSWLVCSSSVIRAARCRAGNWTAQKRMAQGTTWRKRNKMVSSSQASLPSPPFWATDAPYSPHKLRVMGIKKATAFWKTHAAPYSRTVRRPVAEVMPRALLTAQLRTRP
mmetsp:Transcript_41797/g.110176  ORF Transcript_41797/g.110176 Transcript_41797/m.110176 type:complete len:332 (-) Transcript_41797:256-1251(-)